MSEINKLQVAQLWQRNRASSIDDFKGGQFETKLYVEALYLSRH